MIFIRFMLLVLFSMLLHNPVHSQEKQSVTSAQTIINFKGFPITKLVFANGTSRCGYYDSANNVLYDFYGQIILKNSITVREKIADSLCLTKDYDGDGVNDDADKCINEKGPAINFGCPVIDISKTGCTGLKQQIFFATGSSRLSPASVKRLKMLVKILNERPELYIDLPGYTDSIGNYDANVKLSMARSAAAASYLFKAGINKNRIRIKGYGPDKLLAVSKTEYGRAKNRRVEFILSLTAND